jgi:hypothetical protein
VLSAQGAKTATGHYIEVVLLTAIVAALAVPAYYYRHRIVAFFEGRSRDDEAQDLERGPDDVGKARKRRRTRGRRRGRGSPDGSDKT